MTTKIKKYKTLLTWAITVCFMTVGARANTQEALNCHNYKKPEKNLGIKFFRHVGQDFFKFTVYDLKTQRNLVIHQNVKIKVLPDSVANYYLVASPVQNKIQVSGTIRIKSEANRKQEINIVVSDCTKNLKVFTCKEKYIFSKVKCNLINQGLL